MEYPIGVFRYPIGVFGYPTECKDCGFLGEEEVFISSDKATFCPACGSDETVAHIPREDRLKREWD